MSWIETYGLVVFCGVVLSTILVFIFQTRWVYAFVALGNIGLVIALKVLIPALNNIPTPGVLFGVTIAIGLGIARSVRRAGWGKTRF